MLDLLFIFLYFELINVEEEKGKWNCDKTEINQTSGYLV